MANHPSSTEIPFTNVPSFCKKEEPPKTITVEMTVHEARILMDIAGHCYNKYVTHGEGREQVTVDEDAPFEKEDVLPLGWVTDRIAQKWRSVVQERMEASDATPS